MDDCFCGTVISHTLIMFLSSFRIMDLNMCIGINPVSRGVNKPMWEWLIMWFLGGAVYQVAVTLVG